MDPARRRFYAEEVCAVAPVDDPAVADAFASVERERFLGPGPWSVVLMDGLPGAPMYRVTPDADPVHVYHNVAFAIDPARTLNNGHPSSLCRWLAALKVRRGEHVVHLGAGVGYYTAVLAELTGPTGRVTAYEVDPELAARARANLADRPWVTVHTADAADVPPGVDVMFVNAGCTHPRDAWLDALAPGGRLLIPLTAHYPGAPAGTGSGLYVRITRGAEGYAVEPVSRVGIYNCVGARDEAEGETLLAALRALPPDVAIPIRSLVRAAHEPGPDCVVHTARYCLRR